MADDGEKLGTGGRVPDDGVDAGTRGRVSGEDLGVPHTSTPASDSNVGIPTRGRVPGGGVDVGTGGRISDEETYIPVAVAPPSVTRPKRITVAEDPYKYRVPEFDVMLKIPGQDNISLLNERVLMRIGNIIKEFEQDYGQFAVSSVPVTISNLSDFMDQLPDDETIEAEILYGPDREPIFKGILSQKTSDLDIERDEAVLDLEGMLKKYENISAEMMWGTTYELNKFKRLKAVVDKCVEKMGLDESQVIIEEPELTGDEYSFSYYDRVDKDGVVNSVAVDENGIVYQCTEHKIYSLDPKTGETNLLFSAGSLDTLSNLLYHNGFVYFAERRFGESFIKIHRIKIDGTGLQFLISIPFVNKLTEIISSTKSKNIGDGINYPFTPFIYEIIGSYWDMGVYFDTGYVTINDYVYVDFAYESGELSEFYDWNGDLEETPNSEQKIRVFRVKSGETRAWLSDYIGDLPIYLPPGNYCFVAFSCDDDLPLAPAIVVGTTTFFPYSNLKPWDAPKKFKVFYEMKASFDMKICNGVLFYGKSDDQGLTTLWKFNLDTLATEEVTFLVWLWTRSKNRPLCLTIDGQNLIVGYKGGWSAITPYSYIREMKVNSYSSITFIGEYLLDTDQRFYIKEVAKVGSDFLGILQSEDYPNLMETKYSIGGNLAPYTYNGQTQRWDIDNPLVASFPPNPPFYLDLTTQIVQEKGAWVFLPGKVEETENQLDTLNCFKKGDNINLSISGEPYNLFSTSIVEILYQSSVPGFWVNRSRLKLPYPGLTLIAGSKIYKVMGKLPLYSKVKSLSGHELINYTTVYDEEHEIPLYGVVEKTEPVKLTNKNVYRDSEFEITLDNGILIPSTDYIIRDNMGTDKNETWIYLNLIYQGKKVLVTYKYVDPEVIYGNFVIARGKAFFTESKTGRLISYDGTQFTEEGLTYVETQADGSIKTLTEPIKVNETKVQSNLVYDSDPTRDRIYGIIGPGDNVLFQYAKNIALYIPDCKFLNKNVLEVLGECARICNFVVYMDDDGMFYFMPRDYQIETYALTEAEIYSLNTRMAAYEFGETYEKITVRFDGGEVVLGEGIKEYSTGSDYISCRGWATVLDNDLWNYFALNPRIFTIVPKFANGIRPLHGVQISYPPKNIYCYAQVQRVGLNPEDLKMEITAREKKSR